MEETHHPAGSYQPRSARAHPPLAVALASAAALLALAGCQTPPAPAAAPLPSPAAASAPASAPANGGAGDARPAIEAAHAKLVAAYNACDAEAFVAAYGSAFTFVSSSTRVPLTGPAALREHLAAGCKAPPAPSMEIRRQEVTVTGITALVTGQYLFKVPAGASRIDVPQHFTMVMRRAGNDWRVVAHHLSIVPPAAR